MSELPPTVYVICVPSRKGADGTLPRIHPLYAHGNVEYLLRESDPRPVAAGRQTLDLLMNRLRAFRPQVDFIAWVGGDTIAAVLAGVAMEALAVKHFRWLRYDRSKKNGEWTDEGARYTPVWITLEES